MPTKDNARELGLTGYPVEEENDLISALRNS